MSVLHECQKCGQSIRYEGLCLSCREQGLPGWAGNVPTPSPASSAPESNSDSLLTFFAAVFLWIGILAGVAMTALAIASPEFGGMYIVFGIASVVHGLLLYALLKGFADIIKLLKHIASNAVSVN